MHWWDGGAHMGWMAIWWVFGIGLLAVLFSVVARGSLWQGPASESPELFLERRYAKGEIDPRCLRADAFRPQEVASRGATTPWRSEVHVADAPRHPRPPRIGGELRHGARHRVARPHARRGARAAFRMETEPARGRDASRGADRFRQPRRLRRRQPVQRRPARPLSLCCSPGCLAAPFDEVRRGGPAATHPRSRDDRLRLALPALPRVEAASRVTFTRPPPGSFLDRRSRWSGVRSTFRRPRSKAWPGARHRRSLLRRVWSRASRCSSGYRASGGSRGVARRSGSGSRLTHPCQRDACSRPSSLLGGRGFDGRARVDVHRLALVLARAGRARAGAHRRRAGPGSTSCARRRRRSSGSAPRRSR